MNKPLHNADARMRNESSCSAPSPPWIRWPSLMSDAILGIPLSASADARFKRWNRLDDETISAARFTGLFVVEMTAAIGWGALLCGLVSPWVVAAVVVVLRVWRADLVRRLPPESPRTVGVALSVFLYRPVLLGMALIAHHLMATI